MVKMELDEMFALLGNFGKFQIFNTIMLVFPVILSAFRGTEYIFTTRNIPHRCRIAECEGNGRVVFSPSWLSNAVPLDSNGDPEPCLRYQHRPRTDLNTSSSSCSPSLFEPNATETCRDLVFSKSAITIANDFDLLCPSDYWKLTALSSTSVITSMAGLPLSGLIGDRYGRKVELVWGCVLLSVSGLIRSFSPSFSVLLVFEALDGLLAGGIYSTAFILGLETLHPDKRLLGSLLINVYFVVGEVTLAALAWLVQDWRIMIRIFYTPMLLMAILHWILPESVRWLHTRGRVADVEKIFRQIAKLNGTEEKLPVVLAALKDSSQSDKNVDANSMSKPPAKTLRIMAVLRSRIIMWRIAVVAVCWVASIYLYYGISQNAALMGNNQYWSFTLVSLIELPAYLISLWTPDWPHFGRRGSTAASFFVGAAACFAFFVTTPDQQNINLVLFLIGKFSSTLAITVIYIYTAEIFPTELRNSLLALCSMTGRLGSIISQQTPLVKLYVDPMIVFGAASLIGGVLSLTCPETLGIKLPDTIQEAEDIGKKKPQQK